MSAGDDVPFIVDDGERHPIIVVPAASVFAMVRAIADKLGYEDRASLVSWLTTSEPMSHGVSVYYGTPTLSLMVSRDKNSRPADERPRDLMS